MSVVEKKRVNPFFSHENVNTTDATPGGTAAQRGDGRTFQTLSRHVYGFFRRRYAHNMCTTCNVSTYCTQSKDLSGVVAEISDCRDHRHLLSRPSVPCPSLVCLIARYRSIISVLWVGPVEPPAHAHVRPIAACEQAASSPVCRGSTQRHVSRAPGHGPHCRCV